MSIDIRVKIEKEEEIKRIEQLKKILNIKTSAGVVRVLIQYGKL